MIFSSFIFIYLFLPVSLLLYYCIPGAHRNYALLGLSVFFYSWGAPNIVPLLLLSCSIDYLISRYIHPMHGRKRGREALLGVAVALNLILLFYFKYANFFVEQFNAVITQLGGTPVSWLTVALPIGISFFTFQKISYVVDVYRGVGPPTRSIYDYMLYILFFPQLIAGPIVRYHDISELLRARSETSEMVCEGIVRFCLGLAKKVLVADQLGMIANTIFGISAPQLSTPHAWLGMICYSLQLYFDFSGYSDMAIGLARAFGFSFAENFNRPYCAKTFSDFWRRWHISLSSWMKEYLYIPLGGNRGSPARTFVNLWVVFLLSGLWHGAQWTFVLWGGYHGLFLVFDRLLWTRIAERLPSSINVVVTFILVSFGWVIFRAENIGQAVGFYKSLLGVQELTEPLLLARAEVIHNRGIVVFVAALALVFGPRLATCTDVGWFRTHPLLWSAAALMLLFLSTASLLASGYTPFLYFRF